jgi:hypothetical protein
MPVYLKGKSHEIGESFRWCYWIDPKFVRSRLTFIFHFFKTGFLRCSAYFEYRQQKPGSLLSGFKYYNIESKFAFKNWYLLRTGKSLDSPSKYKYQYAYLAVRKLMGRTLKHDVKNLKHFYDKTSLFFLKLPICKNKFGRYVPPYCPYI